MAKYSIVLSRPRVMPQGWFLCPDWRILETYKNWCKECVGADNWNYYGMHKKVPCEFRFKKSEDLLAFKMKFGL
jgi:hypothetical protein